MRKMLFQHQFYRSCIEKKDGISGSTFSNPYLWEAQLFLCDQWHRLRAEWETRQVIQQVCNHSFRWEESMKNFLVSSFALSHLFGCRCSVMGTCEYREGRGSPSLEALGLETPGSFFNIQEKIPSVASRTETTLSQCCSRIYLISIPQTAWPGSESHELVSAAFK